MNISMQLLTISLGDMRPSGPGSLTSFEIMPPVGFFSTLSMSPMKYFTAAIRLAWPFCLRRWPSSVAASGPSSVPAMAVGDPVVEEGLIPQRYSHNPADHIDGQRIGVFIDDVDAFCLWPCRACSLTMRTALRFHVRDHMRRMRRAEVPHAFAARSIVIGRVADDHHGILAVFFHHVRLKIGLPVLRGGSLGAVGTVAKIGAQARIVEQRDDLLISGDDVDAVHHARHRRLAELVKEWVWIGAVFELHGCHEGLVWGHCASATHFVLHSRAHRCLQCINAAAGGTRPAARPDCGQ